MSTAPHHHLTLAAEFPAADRRQWQELVAAALRRAGRLPDDAPAAAAEDALATATYDGFAVRPLYTAEDAASGGASPPGLPGTAPFVRGRTPTGGVPTGWDVRQHHANPDAAATRAAVVTDLENGATSLWLALGPAGIPVEALPEVLREVYLDLAPVVLDAGPDAVAAADAFLAVAADRGVDPAALTGNLGADPLGLRARAGTGFDVAGPLADAAALARRCAAELPGLRAVTVDATPYHDAGGSDAEELGASLAAGVAYLRALTDAGLDVEAALGQLEFRYAATAGQFTTIAKFRAARRLWARVAEVCGAGDRGHLPAPRGPGDEPAGQRQHAVTSSAMLTRRDPWVNLLRGTVAAFAAGVGGADAVTVQPYDAAIGLPDGVARRIARNTSSLLVMESGVARVVDPAGGSWYVESLTAGLAAAAWDWFTEIERAGGIVAALDSGLVAGRLAATWDRRAKRLAVRKDALTGVSEFPNLGEAPVTRVPHPAAAGTAGPAPGALPVHRYAEEYEALRDAADAATGAAGGHRPAVFLATLGPVAVHTARASFAANLFEAGGLATPRSGTSTDSAEVAAAFTASGARVACIASAEAVYAEAAAPVAAALKAAGARRVWLAGRPRDLADVDGYVFAGCDALAAIREAHDLLEVRS
jgi:methylmalonyl-CoA mutase